MSQSVMVSRRDNTERFAGSRHSGPFGVPLDRIIGRLHFPLETECVLTSFRNKVLNYIYRTALGLSAERLESARVSLASTSDEEDSFHLDLTLTVNADWDAAQELAQGILDRVSEWSKEWSGENQEDYGRWIYFGVIPANL